MKHNPHINPTNGRPLDTLWVRVSRGLAGKFRAMCAIERSTYSNELNLAIAEIVQRYEEKHEMVLPMPPDCIAIDAEPFIGPPQGRPVSKGTAAGR